MKSKLYFKETKNHFGDYYSLVLDDKVIIKYFHFREAEISKTFVDLLKDTLYWLSDEADILETLNALKILLRGDMEYDPTIVK